MGHKAKKIIYLFLAQVPKSGLLRYSVTTFLIKSASLNPMTDIVQLDARGLQCPLPLLKLKQQLNRMQKGEQVRIQTTDAGSVRDINAFVRQVGHVLLESGEASGDFHFLIEKGA